MVYDVTFFFEMDVTIIINLVLKLCGMMVKAMIIMMLGKLSLSERLDDDITMDVPTDSVSGICIDWVGHLDIKKGLMVFMHNVIRIVIAWFKSMVRINMVVRVGIGVIVDNSVMISRLIVLIVLLMHGHTSKDISAMVRHCIVVFHPHGMRLLSMYFLVFVVLSERVIKLRSVLLGPELGV